VRFRLINGFLVSLLAFFAAILLIDEMETQRLKSDPSIGVSAAQPILGFLSAERLDVLADAHLQTKPPQYELSKDASSRSVEKNDRRISNWTRLAFLETVSAGVLNDQAAEALRRSYALSPYGEVELMKWRLNFANAYWDQLPLDLRLMSLRQIEALYLFDLHQRAWLIRDFKPLVPLLASEIQKCRTKYPDL